MCELSIRIANGTCYRLPGIAHTISHSGNVGGRDAVFVYSNLLDVSLSQNNETLTSTIFVFVSTFDLENGEVVFIENSPRHPDLETWRGDRASPPTSDSTVSFETRRTVFQYEQYARARNHRSTDSVIITITTRPYSSTHDTTVRVYLRCTLSRALSRRSQ